MQWVVTAGGQTFVVDAGSERDARITATNAVNEFPYEIQQILKTENDGALEVG